MRLFNLYYWCINVCLPWSPVALSALLVEIGADVWGWMSVCVRLCERRRVEACLYLCMRVHFTVLAYLTCLQAHLPSYHPSLHRPPGDAWEKPGWNLSPSWNADDHRGRVGSIRVLMVIIMQDSRRIMSLMTESCRSGMSTLAYWVQSVWMMKEI